MSMINRFEFKAKNETTEDVTIVLFQGSYPDLEEIQRAYPNIDCLALDGDCFVDGTGADAKKVTMKSKTEKTIEHLQKYVDKFKMNLSCLELQSADKRNFQGYLLVGETSPFETKPLVRIPLSDFVSTDQFDANRAVCDFANHPRWKEIILSPVTFVALTICSDSQIDAALSIH